MDNTHTEIFNASDEWIINNKSAKQIHGEIQIQHDDSVYSCILDVSLLNTLKILEVEAGAKIPVIVEDMRNDDEFDYDFEVISINFKLKKTFKSTVTNLTPDQNNKEKIKGRLAITNLGEPAVKCHVSLNLGTQSFSLPKTKSSTQGVQVEIRYQEERCCPFSANKLLNEVSDNKIYPPLFCFPQVKDIPDNGFDEVTLKFGTLAISFPFNGELWKSFQKFLVSRRLRMNVVKYSKIYLPAIYKIYLFTGESVRVALNTKIIENIFTKNTLVAIESDITSAVPATWFNLKGSGFDVSIQRNEMMLHGFRDFERNSSAEFQLEDVWELQERDKEYEANTFFNASNYWRVKHIQVEESHVFALNDKVIDGEVLFDWSPFSAEHDLDEDQWRRLVPATLSHCWVQVPIQNVGKAVVQISPAMLKKYKFIPSGSNVKLKLQVAQRKGFSDIGKCGYFEIRCAAIEVDLKDRSATEILSRRLHIDSIEPYRSSKDIPMLKVIFSDPNNKSTKVEAYERSEASLQALKCIDVADKYCRVAAFQLNNTVYVKSIDSIEM